MVTMHYKFNSSLQQPYLVHKSFLQTPKAQLHEDGSNDEGAYL